MAPKKPAPGMTDAEVKALALQMFRGEVFTSLQIAEHDVEHLMPMIFMPLILMDAKARRELAKKKIGMLYAETSTSAPRSINGYPIFYSFRTVSQSDTKKVLAKFNEIKSAVEKGMKTIQLVCTNSGHYIKGVGIRGIEITARLYWRDGLYFEGKGRTDARSYWLAHLSLPGTI